MKKKKYNQLKADVLKAIVGGGSESNIKILREKAIKLKNDSAYLLSKAKARREAEEQRARELDEILNNLLFFLPKKWRPKFQ